jgi:hypothetical protein
MIIEERFDDAKGYAVNRRAYYTLLTGKGKKNKTMVFFCNLMLVVFVPFTCRSYINVIFD